MDKISVQMDSGRVYFHVLGDNFQYLDLELLAHRHPELEEEIQGRRIALNSEMRITHEKYGSAVSG